MSIELEIDRCEEQIFLAEEGIKETQKFLILSPDDEEDEELLKTLHLYKKELQNQSDRLETLLIKDYDNSTGKKRNKRG